MTAKKTKNITLSVDRETLEKWKQTFPYYSVSKYVETIMKHDLEHEEVVKHRGYE